ncbi:hypothetical protein Tco_0163617 [Tanacetum coccineum]
MNQMNQRRDFSKTYSSVRRPFAKSTAQIANSNAVMGSWGSAVKTSASYNWRNTRPNFNYNSGPSFLRTEHPPEEHVDRGKFDSDAQGNMTGNKVINRRNLKNSMEESVTFVDVIKGEHIWYKTILSDSMNYIPVSLENQANPHAGASEVTNNAGLNINGSHTYAPKLEIFHKPETWIFDEASYDEEGLITDFNSLPTEIELAKQGAKLRTIRSSMLLSVNIQKQQKTITKITHIVCMHAFLLRMNQRKIAEGLARMTVGFKQMQEELVTVQATTSMGSSRSTLMEMKVIWHQVWSNRNKRDEKGIDRENKARLGGPRFEGLDAKSRFHMSSMGELTFSIVLQSSQNKGRNSSYLSKHSMDEDGRNAKYCDKHNQVGFLRKPEESAGFAEIVDFLRGSNLRYALTTNPTIYDSLVKQFWQSATANTSVDGSLEINATIDTIRYTISEASIRDSLQLEDATGITMLPNVELFEGMGQTGYPTDGTFTF